MAEVSIRSALGGAESVKVKVIAGQSVIQVWYGGTQVRVFAAGAEQSERWTDRGIWTLSDEKGRAPDQEEIEKHMEMHFARLTATEENR